MSRAPLKNISNEINVKSNSSAKDPTKWNEQAWRLCYRKIMAHAVVYLDNIDDPSSARLRRYFGRLGTKVSPFFDATEISHVITNVESSSYGALPESHVVTKALQAGRKVWTYEKVMRIVKGLVQEMVVKEPRAHHHQVTPVGLSHLLNKEKLTGLSADRDPTAKRDDYSYFKSPYVLVWDPTHKHRAFISKEYSSDNWPRFSVSSKCPFVLSQASDEGLPPANAIFIPAPTAGRVVKETKEDDAKTALARAVNNRKRNDHQNRLENPLQKVHRTNSNVVHDISASGIQQITSASKSVASHTLGELPTFASKEVDQLKRKLLPANPSVKIYGSKRDCPAPIRANSFQTAPTSKVHRADKGAKSFSTKTETGVAVDSNGNQHDNKIGRTHKERQPLANITNEVVKPIPRKKEGVSHWCENCKESFYDMEEHYRSKKHRKWAQDDSNFTELDFILSMLRRR